MNFDNSVRYCLKHFDDFDSTPTAGELRWFLVFVALGAAAANTLSDRLTELFLIAMVLPTAAAVARRWRGIPKVTRLPSSTE